MSDAVWDEVKRELEGLLTLLGAPRSAQRLYRFAEGFARLARAYHAAVKAEGKTSVRLAVVEKALNLKTGKSALQKFVDEP